MTAWPTVLDERVARRLAMSEPEFVELAVKLGRRFGGRDYSAMDFERAIAYPWERPETSFWMEDGAVELLRRPDEVEAISLGDAPRYPLIAFGSNGAPGVLAEKLAALEIDERDVLVLAGTMHGYDVVASAHVAAYGALPATIAPSASTSVRAGLLMVTAEQFTALTRTEFNYLVARVNGSAFTPDIDVPVPDAVLVYVSRNGALAIDGEERALKAVPATGRVLPEHSQLDLIEHAAPLVLGEGAPAAELVRRTIESYAWAVEVARPALAAVSNPFAPEDWQLLPQ